jgi:hypothetical protein
MFKGMMGDQAGEYLSISSHQSIAKASAIINNPPRQK